MPTSGKKKPPAEPQEREEPHSQFLALVQNVHIGATARSENDLTSKLSAVLGKMGLHTVIDTRVSSGGRQRPDILAYVSEREADLVLPAEIVVECKKPDEVAGLRPSEYRAE